MTGLYQCRPNYLVRISTNCAAYDYEFRNVETALPQLELRHEGLALPDAPPQFSLRNTGVLASLHQQLDHSQIKVGTK